MATSATLGMDAWDDVVDRKNEIALEMVAMVKGLPASFAEGGGELSSVA